MQLGGVPITSLFAHVITLYERLALTVRHCFQARDHGHAQWVIVHTTQSNLVLSPMKLVW